jgi:hypothetical protein
MHKDKLQQRQHQLQLQHQVFYLLQYKFIWLVCQYWYFCPSKASKLRGLLAGRGRQRQGVWMQTSGEQLLQTLKPASRRCISSSTLTSPLIQP